MAADLDGKDISWKSKPAEANSVSLTRGARHICRKLRRETGAGGESNPLGARQESRSSGVVSLAPAIPVTIRAHVLAESVESAQCKSPPKIWRISLSCPN